MLDDNFRVTPVSIFVVEFNLYNFKTDDLTSHCDTQPVCINIKTHSCDMFGIFIGYIQNDFFDFFKNKDHLCIPNKF